MPLPSRRQFLAAPVFLRQSRSPNVLWLMTDEQRPDSLGCYRAPWAVSPNLDALATGGVLFESAYTPSPVCVPCRSALLTGMSASANGVLHNQARLNAGTTMATWRFEDAGYQTASFGKKHYFLPDKRQAFQTEGGKATDEFVHALRYASQFDPAKFDALQYTPAASQKEQRSWILGGLFPEDEAKSAEAQNVDLALQWLEKRDRSRPWLLRLSLNAPHTPVVAPAKYLPMIDPERIHVPEPTEQELAAQPARERVHLRGFSGSQVLTAAQLRKARHYYYARTAFVDATIGRLLVFMRERRLLDSTVVVFLSDHGTHLGDHGLLQKQTFYDQVATVPFFFSGPAIRSGGRVRTPVSTLSLMPTLLQLCGLPHEGFAERSLAASLLINREPPQDPVFSEIAYGYQGYRDADRQVMVREGNLKLSLFPDAGEPDGAFYNLATDPRESRNLFTQSDRQSDVARLRALIGQWDSRRRAA